MSFECAVKIGCVGVCVCELFHNIDKRNILFTINKTTSTAKNKAIPNTEHSNIYNV